MLRAFQLQFIWRKRRSSIASSTSLPFKTAVRQGIFKGGGAV